jgi:hypothetical protein
VLARRTFHLMWRSSSANSQPAARRSSSTPTGIGFRRRPRRLRRGDRSQPRLPCRDHSAALHGTSAIRAGSSGRIRRRGCASWGGKRDHHAPRPSYPGMDTMELPRFLDSMRMRRSFRCGTCWPLAVLREPAATLRRSLAA